ncbi:MAG TPA: EamA family transporter [Lentisphaeria bacterium]|nr:EamA family transporter [Lentisphaeria bacterium]
MLHGILIPLVVGIRIFANSFLNVFQKRLIAAVPNALEINFVMYLLLSLGMLPFASAFPFGTLPPEFWFWAALVGIAGSCGNACMVKALERGELSVLGPINAWKPVVAMTGGILLLSEIPSAGGTAGLGLIVWGSYLVLGADEGKFRFRILLRTDIRYRFAALFCTALEAVFLKKLILLSSTGQAFLANCWAGAVFCLLGTLLLPRGAVSPAVLLRPRGHAAMLILLALCFGAMQYATNTAFLLLPVGPALALFQLSAVVNLWLGWKLFHESGMRRKIAGTVLTVAGAVLIILFK